MGTVHQVRITVPLLIRVALAELAERWGKTESETLELLIREAIRRELIKEDEQRRIQCSQ